MDLKLDNGSYTADVILEGGSGRAAVETPAKITAEGGRTTAQIVWNSPNYDYMKVGDKEYYPLTGEENSTFVIDIPAWDEDIDISAETTAMSEPHMISYTLRFDSESLESVSNGLGYIAAIAVAIAAAVLAAGMIIFFKRKKKRKEEK